jgi:hypothetical protein
MELTPTTQTAHPWRATVRTAFAAALALFPLVNGILLALQGWAEDNAAILPERLAVAINGTVLAGIALTALVTRVLAVPGVVDWCRRHLAFLSPDGKQGRHEA